MKLYCIFLDGMLYGCLKERDDVLSFLQEWDFEVAPSVVIELQEVEFK